MQKPMRTILGATVAGHDTYGYIKFDIKNDLSKITSDMVTSAALRIRLIPKNGGGLEPVAVGKTSTFTIEAYASAYDAKTQAVVKESIITCSYTVTADYRMGQH